ncbi:MAG: hypothetical protein Q8N67_06430 [Candidatus Omnitrophota bacterium]|nr:hypothetical protein [Candidatus Omnitrophota bacterium]
MLDNSQMQEFEKKLEATGEEQVRKNLTQGIYGDLGMVGNRQGKVPLVQNWLAKKDSQRQEAKVKEELNISKEANRIANESNEIARSAKNASWLAIAISIVSIIISTLIVIFRR